MNVLGREIIRTINYETQEQKVILTFITEYALPPSVLLALQNVLNDLSTIDLEVIVTRSLFEVDHLNHKVFRKPDLTPIEQNMMNIQNASGVLIRRSDIEAHVHLEYEWFH